MPKGDPISVPNVPWHEPKWLDVPPIPPEDLAAMFSAIDAERENEPITGGVISQCCGSQCSRCMRKP